MNAGAITFSTALDNTTLDKQLNSLTKKIASIEDKIAQKRVERMPMVEQSEQLVVQLDAAKVRLYEMQSAARGTFSPDMIKEQQVHVNGLQAEWNSVRGRVERYDADISKATIELDRNKEKAGAVAAELAAAGNNSSMMNSALGRASLSMDKILTRIRRLATRVLFFSVITMALRGVREWLGKIIKVSPEASAAIAKLKAALLTLAQPLVNVIIPAFTTLVNILAGVITEIARVVSLISGMTLEQAAASAEALNNETKALDETGAAAKKAGKQLAAFDEINKLGDNSDSGGGSTKDIKADFSGLTDGIRSKLLLTMEDILLNWKDLTGEQILKKIITGLAALAGGIIGFAIGGVGGAVLGMTIGASIGAIISSLIFDNDGKLSTEEILKSIIIVLGTLAGGILGFSVGSPVGAAIGITVGAGIALLISGLIFNGDGKLSGEEIASLVVVALATIAGAVLGFAVGGPGGALIGISAGAGIGLSIKDMILDGDGALSKNEIAGLISSALSVLMGGIIGFAIGGPGGALIGMTAAVSLELLLKSVSFSGDAKENAPFLSDDWWENLFFGHGKAASDGLRGGAGRAAKDSKGEWYGWSMLPWEWFSEANEIGSPSKLFERGGANIVQGLINGLNSISLIPTLRNTFGSIKSWWDAEIAPMMTFTYWQDRFDVFRQALTDRIKAAVNTGIELFNKFIGWVNENLNVSWDSVNIGGNRVIPAGSFQLLTLPKIPMLAQGAVIPPNSEFLALLGDQKRGTNIEAPLETIVAAFRQALRESGGGTVIRFEGDLTELGRILRPVIEKEGKRVGTVLG